MPIGTSKIAPTTESFVMQETRKPSTLKVSKGGRCYHSSGSDLASFGNLCIISMPIGTSEIAPTTESFVMQETRKPSTLKVSKAFPFALIKLSREESDVTLQDINQQNQRIHAPPKKAPEILGTSHLSGKPVIGMTRIRTEGGRGSITILRTKD
ncbi:protein XRI1 [Sorghum bicolor]|uniref:protein XRI1 n=1 Tax=Sorghum bicolor TaxID=4558 RepID=UPI000B424C7C|nr:protein XRI1 [Sorghum bicolor]|eukprot:XP_021316293.1 protein XRI1 [Sorghum bicolor]